MYRRPPKSPLFPYTTLFRSHEARQPCGVSLPFEPCELVGHGLGRDQEFHDAIEAAAMNLPSLAANAFRQVVAVDRKSTRLNSSHANISYAVFCLQKTTTRCT